MKIRRAGAKLFHSERRKEMRRSSYSVFSIFVFRKLLKSKMKFMRFNLCRETQANWNTPLLLLYFLLLRIYVSSYFTDVITELIKLK